MPQSLYMGPTRETVSGLRQGAMSRRRGQLMQGAKMGDPKALEGLYMLDPQMAKQLEAERVNQARYDDQQMKASQALSQKQAKDLTMEVSRGARAILEKPEEEQAQALEQTLDFFESRGENVDPYRGRVDLLPILADIGNPKARNSLKFKFEKNAPFVTKGRNGLMLNTPVFDSQTGRSSVSQVPITDELVSKLGETGDEQSLRMIEQKTGEKLGTAKAADSVKTAREAADSIVQLRATDALYDDAVAELDSGAKVGALDKYTPNLRESSVRLANIRDKLGLDVVASVTFGALSKGELDVAMATAVPPNLNEKDLRQWFVDRKAANKKLQDFYSDVARRAESGQTKAQIILDLQAEKDVRDEVAAGSTPEQQTAPAGAIEYLRANPEFKDKFMQKYGYTPEGF